MTLLECFIKAILFVLSLTCLAVFIGMIGAAIEFLGDDEIAECILAVCVSVPAFMLLLYFSYYLFS